MESPTRWSGCFRRPRVRSKADSTSSSRRSGRRRRERGRSSSRFSADCGPPIPPDRAAASSRTAHHQQGPVRGLEELVSGLAGDVEPDGPQTYAGGDLQTVGALALAAVGFVWLIACTNASNLLISRVSSRRRELARADRARRLARSHRPLPARRERAPGRSAPPPSGSPSHGRASDCCVSWPPTTCRDRRKSRSTGPPLAAARADAHERRALRSDPGAARHRRSS